MAHSLALWGLVETSRYLLQRQREHASRLNKELENKLSGYETSYRFLTEGALNNKRKIRELEQQTTHSSTVSRGRFKSFA
jgi:hypothetical protein